MPKEVQTKKSKLISSLMRELLDWSSKDNSKVVDLKPMSTLQEREIDQQMIDFGKYSIANSHYLVTNNYLRLPSPSLFSGYN